ncbi:hypothetical protein [Methyloceanibacter sp.]|uniref:hypothetical protein n=1 Tax=Methyloceanibacter sp. TaxID=1965321 RepID=UPI003D6CD343
MNKIVKEHYPAAKLPVELREGIDPGGHVTVTVVEEEKPHKHLRTLEEIWEEADRLIREGQIQPVTTEEAVARIRALRDEWD